MNSTEAKPAGVGSSRRTFIHLSEVTKAYGARDAQVIALNNISLNIEKGEIAAVMGPSGSGKSTLLSIIGCLDRPTVGRVYFDGVETGILDSNTLAKMRNKKIGFIFQQFNLIPRLTALENVTLPLLLAEEDNADRKDRAFELLKALGLAARSRHKPSELSGGEQQRVAIARALIHDPPLIIADEPTGNLDSKAGEEVMTLVVELQRKGKTVIIATHSQDLVVCAHRVIYVRDGKIEKES